MLRRLVKILALPIIAAIFLIGWFLYYVGTKSPSLTKTEASNASETQTESNADNGIEMGLIEEQTITQYTD